MALRSVVLAPPPGTGGPRRTVVLRPGGPKAKGGWADIVAALFGILLLVLAIVLVVVLPVKEYATPQFRVTYPDSPTDWPNGTQKFTFQEGSASTNEFKYQLPDNVASVKIVAEFRDDVADSLPDQFRIELFDPAGNPVGVKADLLNPALPLPTNPAENATATRQGLIAHGEFVVTTAAHPSEEILPGLSHLENRDQVLARVVPKVHQSTAGEWTVRVTLVKAGDCPDQGTPDLDAQQLAQCRREQPNGQDTGNEFSLANFIYTTFTTCVEQLGQRAGSPACATHA